MPTMLFDAARRVMTRATHKIYSLPVLVLMPHSSCNCRCVMCDIWRANAHSVELSVADLEPHVAAMRRLGVQWVVLSGGEALMHSNLWTLCQMLRDLPAHVTLLSTGLLLTRNARDVVRYTSDVIVSLDGSQPVHDRIRNIPRAYARLAQGVESLKIEQPEFPVTARCTLQRLNYVDLPNIVASAHELGLDGISFLAADVSSTAFNRPTPWDRGRVADVALDAHNVAHFREVVEEAIVRYANDFASGYIAESPDKMRRLPAYFAALLGQGEFPPVRCNAPWVSAVVESDGAVRPCFFHPVIGHLSDGALDAVLNSPAARQFREELNVAGNSVCQRCTCSLYLSPTRDLRATGHA
ncbi:MAG: radical SAM protein [Anaerolineae bacterium]